MTEKLLTYVEDGIARIVFNQPEKRNAVSVDMWRRLETILDKYGEGPSDVRVLILSGAGGKAFASGADISEFEKERSGEDAVARYGALTGRVFEKLAEFPRPTVAQIDGYCVGGGLAIAACCDIRVSGEGSRFAVPAARLGLGYAYEGVERLVRLVGPAFAKEIFFTARRFDAAEALAMGLVNRTVPDGQVAATCLAMAQDIARNAPLTVAAVKVAVAETRKDAADRDLARCDALVAECFASSDYAEGRRAFMEKREPVFTGR